MSKTILADVEGFTPCIDVITKEYGVMVSAVFGRVWRYCQGSRSVCDASLETIADDLNMGYMTVLRHIKKLVEDGYLEDLTPTARNRPHTYRDTGKVHVTLSLAAGLPKRESERSTNLVEQVYQNDRVGSTNLVVEDSIKIQVKKEEEEGVSRTKGITYFLDALGAKRLNKIQFKKLSELEKTYGTDRLKEMTDWCATNGMAVGRSIAAMETAAKTWGQAKKRSTNGNGRAQPNKQKQIDDEWEAALEKYK